jgi:hypothetical protein
LATEVSTTLKIVSVVVVSPRVVVDVTVEVLSLYVVVVSVVVTGVVEVDHDLNNISFNGISCNNAR